MTGQTTKASWRPAAPAASAQKPNGFPRVWKSTRSAPVHRTARLTLDTRTELDMAVEPGRRPSRSGLRRRAAFARVLP